MNPLTHLRLLLAHRGHRRYSENAGFVMPLVILIGITLTVVGFAMMQRASSQKNDSTSKEATAKALSAAEAGVTRITNLLNDPDTRFLATLPACVNEPLRQAGESCTDPSDPDTNPGNVTPNWQNLSNEQIMQWSGSSVACQSVPDAKLTDVRSIVNSAAWQPMTQGKYRLVGYSYPNGAGVAPGVGTLTVEGIVNEGQANEAVSRVEVKIPVEPGPPTNFITPGLWVTDSTTSGGTETVAGNNGIVASTVLINACDADLSDDELNSDNIIGDVKYTSVSMPSLPENPKETGSCTNDLGVLNEGVTTVLPRRTGNVFTDTQQTVTLNDGVTTVPAYVYCVDSIKKVGSDRVDLTIETLATSSDNATNLNVGDRFMVIIHLQGDIDLLGTDNITHTCVSNCANYKPTDLNIYGHNYPANSSPEIVISGSSSIDAFILAPEYSLGANGTGSGTGISGSVLVKDVSAGSNTSQVVVRQTGSWDDVIEGISPQPTSPTLNALSGWTTKPVN